jgi:hypothetical protein
MASGFKGNYAGARLGLLNCWSFGVDIIRRIVEQHTASHERTERCQHLLTAESAGTATDSGREERANLDGDYDNDHDRDDYDEDRNSSRKEQIQHETTSQHDVSAKNEINQDQDPIENIMALYHVSNTSNAYTR